MADAIEDDALISREQTIWPDIAGLPQATFLEIAVFDRDCNTITDRLTGDLAEKEVFSPELRHDQGGSPLRLRGPRRERERRQRRPLQISPSRLFFRFKPIFGQSSFAEESCL